MPDSSRQTSGQQTTKARRRPRKAKTVQTGKAAGDQSVVAQTDELKPIIRPETITLPGSIDTKDPSALALPRIKSMGRSIFDPIWALKDHASKNTELVFILRGQVKVHTAEYEIPAGEGDIIYTPNGLTHRDVFPLDSEFEVYLVHFHWAGEAAMLREVSPMQLTRASRQAAAVFANDMRQMYADFLQPGPMTAQLTSLRLLQVITRLWHLATAAQSESPAGYDLARARRVQIMTQARHVINERFSQPLGLDDIADAIDVSPYYLSRVFSQEAGFTLSSYLHGMRMEKAASLLRNPRMAVSDVAHAVGFRDAHYFARVFKNHYGSAPSTYRTRIDPGKP